MPIICDVLVIGGGPAGSSAAYSAAANGANTILLEKKKEINQVSCAEGIGSYLFPFLPFKIPKTQLIWRIDGISFSDCEDEIIQTSNFYRGWSLDRKKFDNWLLARAKNIGVKVMMETELVDINFSKGYYVNQLQAKTGNKTILIEPSIIIAADGIESTAAKKLGVQKKIPGSIGNVCSWEMKNLSIKYPHYEQMYFGDFAPGGYAYVFPKSKDTANIGVGSPKDGTNLEKCFDNFITKVIPSQVKNGIKTVDRSGKAPIEYIVPKWRYGNVLFAGDAANQNLKPYIEGILPSIICGDIAGKTASSKGKFNYEELIKRKLGNQFKSSDKLLEKIFYVDQFKGKKKHLLNMHLFAFMDEKIDELADKDIQEIRNELFRKSRRVNSFVAMLSYFIWYAKVLATRSD